MCGITGILSIRRPGEIDQEVLTRMLSIIRYRGPDESGIYIDPHVGLGSVRLSIIGLDGGGQPICNEDGTLWIVYNGEAFNYIELKEKLIRAGHTFSTETDTEVILHLYEEFGPGCLEHINGQFAIAIWDCRKKELFLARDRVGIRPLFYTRADGRLLFSSEIKALFADPSVKRRIDHKALAQVFSLWTTLPGKTLFEDVHELPPGHFLLVRDGHFELRPFWTIPYYSIEHQWGGSIQEAKEELQSLFADAVRIRLRADVPVGAYLSGGLDSSLTSAVIARNCNNRLKTFSIGFEQQDFDESAYQRQMVSWLGTEHRQTLATNQDIRKHFPDVVWHCEKPLLRTAPVPMYLLSKLVRDNNFKVVVTGEGADEIFCGYNIFKEAKIRHFWAKFPESRLRPILLDRIYPYVFKGSSRGKAFRHAFFAVRSEDREDPFLSHRIRWTNTGKNMAFFSDPVLSQVSGYAPYEELGQILPVDFADRDILSKAQLLEMLLFLSNYLLSSQGDRVAMAHSLEIRIPFLDFRVIDFALRLPPRWRMFGLNEKYILKKSFDGFVPESIKLRAKQPYRAPIREVFFGGKGDDYVDEMLSEGCLKKVGLFNARKVLSLVAKHRAAEYSQGSEVQNMAVAGILSTQILHHQFIDDFPWKSIAPLSPDKVVRRA